MPAAPEAVEHARGDDDGDHKDERAIGCVMQRAGGRLPSSQLQTKQTEQASAGDAGERGEEGIGNPEVHHGGGPDEDQARKGDEEDVERCDPGAAAAAGCAEAVTVYDREREQDHEEQREQRYEGKQNERHAVKLIDRLLFRRWLREAIFGPRVGGVAVAARFPEAEAVLGAEFDGADELRAFPGVELWDDDARGAAVLAGERFAVVVRGDEDVVVHAIVEPHVRGVAVVAREEDVLRFGLWVHELGEREEGDAGPADVEFAPRRDAVKITDVFETRQRVEFFPAEGLRPFDGAGDLEAPVLE